MEVWADVLVEVVVELRAEVVFAEVDEDVGDTVNKAKVDYCNRFTFVILRPILIQLKGT